MLTAEERIISTVQGLTAGVSGKSGTLTGRTQGTKKPFSADSPQIEPSPLLSAARGVGRADWETNYGLKKFIKNWAVGSISVITKVKKLSNEKGISRKF
jgi:hypothetical protein